MQVAARGYFPGSNAKFEPADGPVANCQVKKKKKKLAPSSILREAKIAYYARNMFEAGRFFFS